MDTSVQAVIDRVKIQTVMHQPFFGAGATKMRWFADDTIATACTDGKVIRFNPDFLLSLNKQEQVGLCVHEVMHVYSKHHLRRGNRDPMLWNVAGDYFINQVIIDAIKMENRHRGGSCMRLPDGALIDERFRGMSTDQIYDLLKKEQDNPDNPDGPIDGPSGRCPGNKEGNDPDGNQDTPQSDDTTEGDEAPAQQPQDQEGQGQSDGGTGNDGEEQAPSGGQGEAPGRTPVGSWGDVIDAHDVDDEAERAYAEREVEVLVEQASQAAKSRGLMPGAAQSVIDDYKTAKVDWRSVLRQLMQSMTAVDYTYTRPHKKHHHMLSTYGSFIPDYHKENMGELVVAIDTSGSVSDDEAQQFLGEIADICEDVQPSTVHVVQCDYRIHKVDTFERGDEFNVGRIVGRGGTHFQPVFDWVEENEVDPVALIYLTDGEAPAPDAPDYPVIWGVTNPQCLDHLPGEALPVDFS